MDKRNDICKQIQSLDSEMQTLVYENYNKFISATDTIRKVSKLSSYITLRIAPLYFLFTFPFIDAFQMKNDFKKMEDEMDGLATNMESITKFSGTISNTLQDRRQQITKLSNCHSLLRKVLHFHLVFRSKLLPSFSLSFFFLLATISV